MNLPWVQQWAQSSLGGGLRFSAALLHGIQVGCAAPIVTVAWDLLQVSMLLQIRQSPFDRGA